MLKNISLHSLASRGNHLTNESLEVCAFRNSIDSLIEFLKR